MIARSILVRGRVQGVFYRNWAVETAKRHRITGWVRNRRDGDVEILAMGDAEKVDDFERECWRGPFGARVETVISGKAQMEPLQSFERRPTA